MVAIASTDWQRELNMTEDRRNVVITGFMGTGKSMVARRIAEEMGRSFVDMDEEIVRRAGKSICPMLRCLCRSSASKGVRHPIRLRRSDQEETRWQPSRMT